MDLDKELEISEKILDYLYAINEKGKQDSIIDLIDLKKYLRPHNTDINKFTVHINFKYGFYEKYPYETNDAIKFYTKVIRMFKLKKILE